MAFTDSDLAKLKVACLASLQEHGNKDAKDILSLIDRLEAAEKALEAWQIVSDEWHSRVRNTKDEFEKRMEKANAIEAWRKEAGR